MAWLAATVVCVVCAFASAERDPDTPVQKVITLLEELKATATDEGKTEADSYGTFSSWCESQTEKQTESIRTGKGDIDETSGTIKKNTVEHAAAVKKRGVDQATKASTEQDLKDATSQHEVDASKLNAKISDLDEAHKALGAAKEHLTNAKTVSPTALVQLRSVAITAHRFGMGSAQKLDQEMSEEPDFEYEFRSNDIVKLLEQLESEFFTKKGVAETDLQGVNSVFQGKENGFKDQIDLLTTDIAKGKTAIDGFKEVIAGARINLLAQQVLVEDANLYLKDLTKSCENKANTYDQRAQTRADEVDAIQKAVDILRGDASTNEAYRSVGAPSEADVGTKLAQVSKHVSPVSLLQLSGHDAVRQLRGSHTAAKPEIVANMLSVKGKQIGSTTLLSLSSQLLEAGPFTKVKQLIQNLIERLLAESESEVTKEFWCKKEMDTAKKEQGFRHAQTEKLSIEIQALRVTQEQLAEDIDELHDSIVAKQGDLGESNEDRQVEKEQNSKSITDAQAGLVAVKEAISILQKFYKQAAKAFVQTAASPIDEVGGQPATGFSGAYQGKQGQAGGIFGLLEVIQSDFERTIRKTAQSEKEATEDHVKLSRSLNVAIKGDSTKKKLNTADEEDTKSLLLKKKSDLKTQQDLLDAELRTIVELTPMCVAFHQSHADRKLKREEEIDALKSALCHLDPLGVEENCP